MASLSDVIDIVIRAEDQASRGISAVGASIGGLADGVSSVTAPMASLTEKILILDAALVALGTALVKTGVDEAGKFETSFKFIGTLFEAGSDNVARFRQDILDYASGSTQSLASITAALQEAIGAGVDYSDALGILAEAERLAIAQGATLDETTGLLTDTLQAYGLSMDNAAKLSDQFSVAIRDGKVSASELTSQLSNVSPIAAAAGVGFDQVGSAIAVLTTQGFPAGQAITAIKAILEGLIRPTKEASEYATELGISFGSTALKSDGLQGVLQKVFTATNGNVDAMAKLFTTSEGLGGALALGGNGAEKFREILLNMASAAGATDAAFSKMADGYELQIQRMQNAIQIAAIELGDPLLDEFGGVADGVAAIFTRLAAEFQDGGALRPLTQALEAFGASLRDNLAKIAENLPEALDGVDFSDFLASFGKLGQSIENLFGDLDLTSAEGLERALQGLIDTGTTLVRVTSGIVDGLRPFAEAAADVVREINSSDEATQQWAGEVLGLATGINSLLPAVAGLGTGLSAVGTGLTSLAAAQALALLHVTSFTAGLSGMLAGLTAIAAPLAAGAAALGSWAWALDRNLDAFEDYKARTNAAADATANIAAVTERSAGVLDELNQRLGTSFDSMGAFNAAVNAGELVWDGVRAQWVRSGDALATMTSSFSELTADQFDLMETTGTLADEFRKMGDGLGVANPALLMLDQRVSDVVGSTGTLKTETGAVVSVMRDANGNITGYAQAAGTLGEKLSETAQKTKDAVDESENFRLKLLELQAEIQQSQLEAFVSIKTTQLETDAQRVQAVFESIDTTVSSTGDLLGSLFSNLIDATSLRDKFSIEEQIDLENKRRQEALDIQTKLASAEIARIQAQTEALERGDSIITIEGDGLEPELEAFMWAILKRIRIRANAEFQDYLLGMSIT